MKKTLDEIRRTIDEIDQEMAILFLKRMEVVSEVASYKKEHRQAVSDLKREQELLKKNKQYLNQPDLERYYERFFSGVLEASKSYQEDLLK